MWVKLSSKQKSQQKNNWAPKKLTDIFSRIWRSKSCGVSSQSSKEILKMVKNNLSKNNFSIIFNLDAPDCKVLTGCKTGETPLTHGCRRKSNPAFGTPWSGDEDASLVDPFRKRRNVENVVEPSKNGKFSSHKIADDLWHVVDHYFKDCLNVRKHLNKVNKLTNTLDKVKKRWISKLLYQKNVNK